MLSNIRYNEPTLSSSDQRWTLSMYYLTLQPEFLIDLDFAKQSYPMPGGITQIAEKYAQDKTRPNELNHMLYDKNFPTQKIPRLQKRARKTKYSDKELR